MTASGAGPARYGLRLSHIPNLICVFRIVLVWPIVVSLLDGRYLHSLLLIALAGFSDGLDGFLAKHFDWRSRLGGLLDPIADKLLLVSTFLTLTITGLVPVWLTAVVILRDVTIVSGGLAYHVLVARAYALAGDKIHGCPAPVPARCHHGVCLRSAAGKSRCSWALVLVTRRQQPRLRHSLEQEAGRATNAEAMATRQRTCSRSLKCSSSAQVRLADHAVFGNFHTPATGCSCADRSRGRWQTWPDLAVGAPGSAVRTCGACRRRRRAGRRRARAAGATPGSSVGILEGRQAATLVSSTASTRWPTSGLARGLFALRECAARRTLVLSATATPAAAGIRLAVVSRFASGSSSACDRSTTRFAALTLRARFRGFELPEETGRFLLARQSRSPVDLFDRLDELDRAGLAAQKRLTVPFVRQVIASFPSGSG